MQQTADTGHTGGLQREHHWYKMRDNTDNNISIYTLFTTSPLVVTTAEMRIVVGVALLVVTVDPETSVSAMTRINLIMVLSLSMVQ